MLKKLIQILLVGTLAGCAVLERRQTEGVETPPRSGETRDTGKESDEGLVVDEEMPPPLPAQPQPKRLALILGGGGLKAYAHIGVLKAFQEAKIPVRMITGLEWGALPAALFSVQERAHEVEWKMFRLQEGALPEKGFFSSQLKMSSISSLDDFLEQSFGKAKIESASARFSCPAYSIQRHQSYFQKSGPYASVIKRCLSYPPFFHDYQGWLADPFAIEAVAQNLKENGADIVVYVDVVGGGDIFYKEEVSKYLKDYLLWSAVRRQASQKLHGVDKVIKVPTKGLGLMDYEARRNFVNIGYKAATPIVKQLGDQYEF